jgi:hypothetical protein
MRCCRARPSAFPSLQAPRTPNFNPNSTVMNQMNYFMRELDLLGPK